MTKEKSLEIVKESFWDKIKNFIIKMFKGNQDINNKEENSLMKEEKDTREEISLEERIEKENISLQQETEERFEEINANLSRYLEKIQKEINKTEKANLENNIQEYHDEFARYREKMAN